MSAKDLLEKIDPSKIIYDKLVARMEKKRRINEMKKDMEEDLMEAYMEGFKETKLQQMKEKGMRDAKPGGALKKFAGFAQKFGFRPYTQEEMKNLFGVNQPITPQQARSWKKEEEK